MKQNYCTMSRREERQAIMKLRTEKLLWTSTKEEYSIELYPHEVKWLRKNYPQVTVSSQESVGKGEMRMCTVKKKNL